MTWKQRRTSLTAQMIKTSQTSSWVSGSALPWTNSLALRTWSHNPSPGTACTHDWLMQEYKYLHTCQPSLSHPPHLHLESSRRVTLISKLHADEPEASAATASKFSFFLRQVLYSTHCSWAISLANILQASVLLSLAEPNLWQRVTSKSL